MNSDNLDQCLPPLLAEAHFQNHGAREVQTSIVMIQNMEFIDLPFDSAKLAKVLSSQAYTDEQKCLIKKMKSVHRLNDETLNILKLIIYDWDINDAVTYYQTDKFCIDYFVSQNPKQDVESNCPCKRKHKYNFYEIWNKHRLEGYELLERITKCILYTNKRPNCSNLYSCYGHLLRRRIKTKEDGLECEKYFLKAISLNDKNCDAHSGYAMLLERESFQIYNFEKAMKHYELACGVENDPNAASFCENYARSLWKRAETKEEHEKVLFYAEKTIKLNPNSDPSYLMAASALYGMQKYQQSIEYHEKLKELTNNYESWFEQSVYIIAKLFTLAEKNSRNDVHIKNFSLKSADDWSKLYQDYIESNGYFIPFKDKNSKCKYLSYFNEIEMHSNNETLKTTNKINCLVYGYVKQNTNDIYDLSSLTKIILKYFGPPGNESIFTVRLKDNAYDRDIQNKSKNRLRYLERGHLYRSIVFNRRLTSESPAVQFKVIKSNICDYWKKHTSLAKLGFGFAIGIIQLDLNENIAFECNNNVNNIIIKKNDNPLLLSNKMNLFLTDLISLYSRSLKFLAGVHFIFDKNKKCFIYKDSFLFRFRIRAQNGSYLTNIDDEYSDITFENQDELNINVGQTFGIGVQNDIPFLTIEQDYALCNYDDDIYRQSDDNDLCWFPVVSCVGCNCGSPSNSPLVLDLISNSKHT